MDNDETSDEKKERLVTPHIEIGRGREPPSNRIVYLNVDRFKACSEKLIYPGDLDWEALLKDSHYSVFRVRSRVAECACCGEPFVDTDEPPISRFFIGYLEGAVLKEKLPQIWGELQSLERPRPAGS